MYYPGERNLKADKKTVAVIVLLCTAMFPIAVAVWSLNTIQAENPELFIDPPSLYFDALVPGKRFSINISVAKVTDLKSYELKLSYNTLMLDVVDVAFLPDANLPVGNLGVNDTSGVIWISTVYDGDAITTASPVTLAVITFKMMGRGISPLHLYDTALKDSLGVPITHSTGDGVVYILRHDVAVVYVAPSTFETYIGRVVNVTVTVENKGDAAESFTVKAYHNDTVFGTFDVIDLAAGSNTTIVFNWNTSDVGAGHNYAIKAEAVPVPSETDTTNNVLVDGTVKVKIIADVNNDNVVDINDLVAWDAAYGSTEGEPNWNPQADMNNDGVVNNDDGIIIIQNYHNTP